MNDKNAKSSTLSYSPHYLDSTKAILEAHLASLRGLLGKTLSGSWVAWELNEDEWFNDAPVVLDFEGQHLELNFFGMDKLSITFNTLDLSERFNWGGLTMFDLVWRKDALSELNSVKNARLEKVEVSDVLFESEVVAHQSNPSVVGQKSADWLLGGMNFWFSDDKFISVFNGLDENAVTSEQHSSHAFRHYQV